MPVPRREPEELFAKYHLHPNLLDIYVEGDFDFDFLNLIFEDLNVPTASVFSIDDINIPGETIDYFGLHHGSNKQRLLALGHLFDSQFGKRSTNVTCLVDIDNDRVLQKTPEIHHVSHTDYTCAESYFLNSATIKRFLTIACQLDQAHVQTFLGLAKKILPTQFSLRAVSEKLELNKAILSFESGLKNKKSFDSFDSKKYINNYINHHALNSNRVEIESEFQKIINSLPQDIRHTIQGHDFINLLFEYISSNGVLKFHDKSKTTERHGNRLVALSCRANDLIMENLFNRILLAASSQHYLHP
jgi:hypothetical protein